MHTACRLTLVVLCALAGALFFNAAALAAGPPEAPEAVTPTEVKAETATLQGTLSPKSPGEVGSAYDFIYKASTTKTCTGGAATTLVESIMGLEAEPVSEPIAGLTPGTEYAVCLRTENNTKTQSATSAPVTFTTAIHPETPEKLEANPIAANTATLNGVLNPAAPSDPGTYEFRYRQSATECEGKKASVKEKEEEKATPATPSLGGEKEAANAPIAELLPHTAYTFCLLAHNEAGEEALSAPETFTTLAAVPKIEEQSATEVSATGAKLNATVNPEGAATSYAFEYAPAGSTEFKPVPEPGAVGTLPEGTSGVAVSVKLQHGLAPGSSYQFRIVIGNSVQQGVTEEAVSFTTQQVGGEFVLPDGRQYEMVTPPAKEGALFKTLPLFTNNPLGGLLEASAAGNAIVDPAQTPSETNPQGYAIQASVFSTRGSGGWSSRVLDAPHAGASGPAQGYANSEDIGLSEDLSSTVVQQFGAFTPLSPEATEETPYIRTNYLNGNVTQFCTESCYQPLLTRANTPPGLEFGQEPTGECVGEAEVCGAKIRLATPDLSHLVIASKLQLTSMPAQTGNLFSEPDRGSILYEWSAGQLQPVSVYPDGALAEAIAPGSTSLQYYSWRQLGTRHAISENGNRVLFIGPEDPGATAGLYLRDLPRGETLQVPGYYLGANSDMSKIFLTTTEFKNASNSLNVFEVTSGEGEPLAGHLTDLSVAANPGEDPDFQGLLGMSENGEYVYFAAGGALAPGAVQGACTVEGDETEGCNVYVSHDGVTKLVAPGWINGGGGGTADMLSKASADGRWLAFMSSRSLTGYHNRDASSGRPDDEVYLYHAPEHFASEAGTLTCASCDPTGARPVGKYNQEGGQWVAANVSSWDYPLEKAAYQPRYLSDSGRLFFNSYDALVPKDSNGVQDVYEYEPEAVPAGAHACSPSSTSASEVYEPAHAYRALGEQGEAGAGCVALISSGTSSRESTFLDASAGDGPGENGVPGKQAGSDIFFLTTAQLAPQDTDEAADVYDAHECTTSSPCIAPPQEQPLACTTEASCKAPPTPQPAIYGAPSSATFSGPGNLTPPPLAVVKPKPKSLTRAQKLAAALKVCKKDKKKTKRAECEKQARSQYGPVKKTKKAKKSARKSSTNGRTGR